LVRACHLGRRTNNREAIRLTHAIAHLFAELSAGDLTPAAFLRDLAVTASESEAGAPTSGNWKTAARLTTDD
jgi:hypothetical protein